MTFQDAIISVINDFGKDILSNASLQNFLNDYNAFDESKSFRVILKNLISEGYLDQMLLIKNWDSSSSQLCARFVDNTGFQIEKAEYVVNSLAYALGISKSKADYTQSSQQQSQPTQSPVPQNKRQATNNSVLNLTASKLEKLNDDDQIAYKEEAEIYLDNILEIKGNCKRELGANLTVTSDFDPSDNTFKYRMEIDGMITAKYEYSVLFKFVIYRADGRAAETVSIYCEKNKRSYQVLESDHVFEKSFKTIGNISKVVMYWEIQ